MGFWSSLLTQEFDLRKQLEADFAASTVTLFDQFAANPGGQTRFFNAMPLDDVSDKTWRWAAIIGGIGCVAGETIINGVPIAERTRPAMVDTLAGQSIATESYIKGQADLYRVTTKSGSVVLVTLDHQFLTLQGWVRLRDLRVGALIAADGSGRALSEKERSKGSPGCYSLGSHPGDELPSPAQVADLSRWQQLHKTDDDSNARLACNLLSTDSFALDFSRRHADALHRSVPSAYESLRYQRQSDRQSPLPSLPRRGSERLSPTWEGHSSLALHGTAPAPYPDQAHCRLCEPPYPYLDPDDRLYADSCPPRNKPSELPRRALYESRPSLETAQSVLRHERQRQERCLAVQQYAHRADLSAIQQIQHHTESLAYPCINQYSSTTNDTSFWDEITDLTFARYDDFYDLHVPEHNHYAAHGLWHHNSGKSYCGAAWAASRGLMAPECRGLITANTFGQLSRSTVITLVEVCRQFNIPLLPYRESVEDQALAIVNAQRCYIGENRAFAYVLSMNSFTGKTQAARGLQVRWVWADEAAYSDEQAFRTLDGRMGRGPGVMKGMGLMTTSPAGFNWLYDRVADPNRGEDKERLYVMFNCSTRENVKHLGEDYVDGLTANYTEELAQQELEGVFINSMVGRVYKYVSRPLHALSGEEAEVLDYEPSLPLHVTFDFNHSPAVALLAQVKNKELHCFQEFYCLDSDTWELSEQVAEHIKDLEHSGEVFVYGDATGASRTANSKHTNWDIVFEAFAKIGIRLGDRLHKRFDKTNPRVTNRVNSVNCLAKQNRLFMHFEHCKELVKDFEVLTWSGEGIDKGDLLRSHLSDACGYLAHRLFPYKAAPAKGAGKKGALPGIAA